MVPGGPGVGAGQPRARPLPVPAGPRSRRVGAAEQLALHVRRLGLGAGARRRVVPAPVRRHPARPQLAQPRGPRGLRERRCGSGSTAASTASGSTWRTALFKEEGLPDVGPTTQRHARSGNELDSRCATSTGSTTIYRRWRQILAEYDGDRIGVAEAWTPTAERTALYVRPDELHQTFNFHCLLADWSAASFARGDRRARWPRCAPVGAPPPGCCRTTTWSGTPPATAAAPGLARARAATLAMLALPGSAYLYQGEELGLEQVDVPARAPPGPGLPPRPRRRAATAAGCRSPGPATRRRTASGRGTSSPGCRSPATGLGHGRGPDGPTRTRRWRSTGRPWPPARAQLAEGWDDDIAWLDLGADVLAFRRGPLTVVVNCGDDAIKLPEGDVVVATEEHDGRSARRTRASGCAEVRRPGSGCSGRAPSRTRRARRRSSRTAARRAACGAAGRCR